jgi:hypothetical protein
MEITGAKVNWIRDEQGNEHIIQDIVLERLYSAKLSEGPIHFSTHFLHKDPRVKNIDLIALEGILKELHKVGYIHYTANNPSGISCIKDEGAAFFVRGGYKQLIAVEDYYEQKKDIQAKENLKSSKRANVISMMALFISIASLAAQYSRASNDGNSDEKIENSIGKKITKDTIHITYPQGKDSLVFSK